MKSPLPASRSGLINNNTVFNFCSAVSRLVNGEHLTREAWGSKDLFMFLGEDGNLKLSRDGVITDLILHRNDFESEDWISVNEV